MHRVCPPYGLGTRLREAQVAHLPCLDELLHRADGFLDGHLRVHPVLVVEVYSVYAEPPERGVARSLHVVRLAVDADPAPVLAPLVAELGGEDYLLAPARYGLADELLVGERAVHVRGVEEVDAKRYRPVDGGDRLLLVRGAVELAHPHAPEAQGGDDEPLASQVSPVHKSLLPPEALPPEFTQSATGQKCYNAGYVTQRG